MLSSIAYTEAKRKGNVDIKQLVDISCEKPRLMKKSFYKKIMWGVGLTNCGVQKYELASIIVV